MPRVIADSLADACELVRTSEGYSFTRSIIVDELTGGNAIDKLNAVLKTKGVPIYGSRAPGSVDVYAYAFKVKFMPSCTSKAVVMIEYSPYQQNLSTPTESAKPEIYCGAALVTKKTNLDIKGEVMTVSYQKTTESGAATSSSIDVQSGSVEIQIPQPFLQFARKEPRDPSRKSEFFTGKINSGPWYGDAGGLWLCTKIEGKRRQDGAYDVTYEFQKSNFGWKAAIVYVDPATGKTPSDVVEGTGIKEYDVYRTADFNALNLGV